MAKLTTSDHIKTIIYDFLYIVIFFTGVGRLRGSNVNDFVEQAAVSIW